MKDINFEYLVRLIDDDESLLRALSIYLQMLNIPTATYRSASDFLRDDPKGKEGCVVLDVRMPGMSGIELFEEMKRQKIDLPVIFLSAHGDIDMAVRAVQQGARTFLEKPPQREKFVDVISDAVLWHHAFRREKAYLIRLRKQWDSLTPAEKQVCEMTVKGLTGPRAAEVLGIKDKTLRAYRMEAYSKLEVENIAELSDFLHEMKSLEEKLMSE